MDRPDPLGEPVGSGVLSRAAFGAAFDRMQGTAATALALVAIALVFVYLVPRQGDIAAYLNARRAAALEAQQAENAAPAPQPDAAPAPAAVEPEKAPEPLPPPAAVAPNAPAPAAEVASVEAETKPSPGRELLVRPVALDTATILIRQGKVRLAGIEAAPLSRKCGGEDQRGWFCGVEARTHFRSWLRARSISCEVPPGFGGKAEEVEARCDLAGEDIGRWLVANGYAEAQADSGYKDAERQAKAAKRGIWAEQRPAE